MTIKVIFNGVLTIVEVFAPLPTELVKRFGARKIDDKYEISAINLPWVIKQEINFIFTPGEKYVVDGVEIDGLVPPWEAYVSFVDPSGEFGIGYIATGRRRMFECVHKVYTTPLYLQLAPYIVVKPVELLLSDKPNVIDCVERVFHARYIAVFINAPINIVQKIKTTLSPNIKRNI
ncbi:hypothetical protein [Pyrobaculum islandicum]|uniref:hypothetical protein n=1 Tax=Pyrobaculum islandicum TaxID=2277 RepID=UPI000A47A20A|nr:hypothetical protein [Pyrobaculum islandicum]